MQYSEELPEFHNQIIHFELSITRLFVLLIPNVFKFLVRLLLVVCPVDPNVFTFLVRLLLEVCLVDPNVFKFQVSCLVGACLVDTKCVQRYG